MRSRRPARPAAPPRPGRGPTTALGAVLRVTLPPSSEPTCACTDDRASSPGSLRTVRRRSRHGNTPAGLPAESVRPHDAPAVRPDGCPVAGLDGDRIAALDQPT